MAAIYDSTPISNRCACGTLSGALQQWKSLTGTALKSPKKCPFLIFMDPAELLAEEQLPARSRTGSIKSLFTDLCRFLPPKMGCFCAGMLNLMLCLCRSSPRLADPSTPNTETEWQPVLWHQGSRRITSQAKAKKPRPGSRRGVKPLRTCMGSCPVCCSKSAAWPKRAELSKGTDQIS